MESDSPRDLLAEAGRVRSAARRERRGAWFALVLFGIIVLAAAPLYKLSQRTVFPDGSSTGVYGGWWVPLYWTIAVPLAYLGCVLYYRRHASRTGVAGSFWPYVAVGLGLFALMAFVPPGIVVAWGTPSFILAWTSLPLLTLGVGFLVLSRLERSWYLATFSVVFLLLPTVSGRIYGQVVEWRGVSATGFSMAVAGLALLLAGAVSWASRRRTL